MSRRAVLALVGLLGCVPPPLDETGKRCGASFGQCSADYVCVGAPSVCQPLGSVQPTVDAGPMRANLLGNPSFERALQAADWSGNELVDLFRVATPAPDAGQWAGSIISRVKNGYADSALVEPRVPPARYCAQAWVRARSTPVVVKLGVHSMRADGGIASEDTTPSLLLSPDAGYVLVGPVLHTPNADDAWAQLRVRLEADAGVALLVDDVKWWVAGNDGCTTPPASE